jgi:hypothetical protein
MTDTTAQGRKSESTWRWALRVAGLASFVLCGILLVTRGSVPVAFLLVGAAMMGLDSIQGFELRRRNGREPDDAPYDAQDRE